MFAAIKYAATWLAFLTFHVDTRAATRCAEQSAQMPYGLLDPVERRLVVLLCILAITFASASAWWLLPLLGV